MNELPAELIGDEEYIVRCKECPLSEKRDCAEGNHTTTTFQNMCENFGGWHFKQDGESVKCYCNHK